MRTPRALVIDDEPIVLDSVAKVLLGEDWEVDVTESAPQGLAWGTRRAYDIVLTDIRMPEIDGLRVLRDLKRAQPAVPVLIITGYATVRSAVQAMKLGAADYLEKPFTPEELLGAVSAAVGAAATQPPPAQNLVHRQEVLQVLERAAADERFAAALDRKGAEELEAYGLTAAEMLALLTGDLAWVEEHVGPLTETQRRWFQHQLSGEPW